MYKKVLYFLVLLLLIFGPLFLGRRVQAESSSFDRASLELGVNQTAEVVVTASQLLEIGTLEFVLIYDPAYLSLVEVKEKSLMSPVFGVFSATSSESGLERLRVAVATSLTSISGSGELVSISFQARNKSGQSVIQMESMTAYPGDFSPPISITPAKSLVVNIKPEIISQVSVLAESWIHGSSDPLSKDYWNLVPVNPRSVFQAGESVCVLSRMPDMKNDHRWKTVFYLDNQIVWTDESPWLRVGTGWDYTNAMPILYNLKAGSGMARVYLDVGQGYELKSELFFQVNETQDQNLYLGSQVCSTWSYGNSEPGTIEYWNWQCVEARNLFNEGERAYLLSQVTNISETHEWLIKVYKDGVFQWQYSSGLQNAEKQLWAYSNFAPYVDNLRPGSYRLEAYFRTTGDFSLLGSQEISVNAAPVQPFPFLADFDSSEDGFFLEKNNDSLATELSRVNIDGRSALLMSSAPTSLYWHTQAKKLGLPFVQGKTYQGSIWIKGEKSGKVYVTVQKDSSPWNNLGLWKEIDLTTTWQKIDLSFTCNGQVEPSDIRFALMFGHYEGGIWIDELRFSE